MKNTLTDLIIIQEALNNNDLDDAKQMLEDLIQDLKINELTG